MVSLCSVVVEVAAMATALVVAVAVSLLGLLT